MSTFLHKVATEILANHPTLENITIILPSRRAAVFLKKELAIQLTKPIWSPRITTIEDFLMAGLGLEQADQPTLIFRLYESYCEVKGEPHEPFAEFSQWAQLLLADFNEIDRYLVDAKQLFGYLADVERIKKWDLEGGEMSDMLQNYLGLWELLPELYDHFYRRLIEEKMVYQGVAYREMHRNLDSILPEIRKQYGQLIFVGFNALNTAEENILTQLYREGIAKFYWDVDRYYFNDPDQEAGLFLRESKLVNELIDKNDFHWVTNQLSESKKQIEIIGVNGDHLQAVAANSAILDYKESDLEEVAVVLADEKMLPSFLNNLAEEVDSLNVTMGIPLRNTPVAGFFEILIKMMREQEVNKRKDRNGNPSFHYQRWDDLLGHFVTKFWTGQSMELEETRTMIRKNNHIFLSVHEIAEQMAINQDLSDFFDKVGDISDTWNQLSRLAEKLHEKLSGQGELTQSLYGFFKLFNRLGDLMADYPYVNDWQTAQRFYRDLISSETIDLTGDPLSGLQLMGMLETRTLDFKHLIITSLNEDVLPKGRSENSLIPFDIKMEFGLPTYLEKDAVFAYHFYRLLQRAERVTLIYNNATEGLNTGEPSRFITQLELELPPVNSKVEIVRRLPGFPIRINDSEENEIVKTPAVMKRLEEMAEHGISPTALTDYINDPIEFYKKRVLNLKESDEVEEVAGYDTQGNVIHGLLEHLYSDSNGKCLPELYPGLPVFGMKVEQVREMIVERLIREAKLSDLKHGKNLIIREILTGMVANFLQEEKWQLEENGSIELLGLEQKLEGNIQLDTGLNVKIKGIIDRVDMQKGITRVIDYKTGSVNKSKLNIKELDDLRQPIDGNKSLQLMTYAWLYLNNNSAVEYVTPGIISLRDTGSWVMPLTFDKKLNIDRSVTGQYEAFLKKCLEEIFDRDSPFTKKLLTLQSDD